MLPFLHDETIRRYSITLLLPLHWSTNPNLILRPYHSNKYPVFSTLKGNLNRVWKILRPEEILHGWITEPSPTWTNTQTGMLILTIFNIALLMLFYGRIIKHFATQHICCNRKVRKFTSNPTSNIPTVHFRRPSYMTRRSHLSRTMPLPPVRSPRSPLPMRPTDYKHLRAPNARAMLPQILEHPVPQITIASGPNTSSECSYEIPRVLDKSLLYVEILPSDTNDTYLDMSSHKIRPN